jgi:phosphoglycerate dehydrogenase-like enzyme
MAMKIKKASPGLDQRNQLGRLLGSDFTVEDYDGSRPLADQVDDAEVLLVRDVPVDDRVMAAAPKLKLIQRPGAHIVGIDYDAAKARGIIVSRFPSEVQGQPARDVAEHAFFLLLAIAKRFRQSENMIGSRKVGLPKTVRLDGKTLALIGVGKTGAELAKLARGFGIRVIAIKQTPDPVLAKALGIAFMGGLADLPKVLAEADFVSLHLPNNKNTAGFLGQRQFAQMKPGALLVNIARAPMVDKAALQEALASGHLGGAGLDVCWQEPIDPRDPLLALPNVIVTPHIAGDTEELELRLAELAAANIRLVADGKKPAYVVGVDVDPL